METSGPLLIADTLPNRRFTSQPHAGRRLCAFTTLYKGLGFLPPQVKTWMRTPRVHARDILSPKGNGHARHPEMQVAQAGTRQPGTRDSCVSLCFPRISPFILTYNFPSQTCSSAQFHSINHVHRVVQPSPPSSPERSHRAKRRLGPRSTPAPIPSCCLQRPSPHVVSGSDCSGPHVGGIHGTCPSGSLRSASALQGGPAVAADWIPFFFQVE